MMVTVIEIGTTDFESDEMIIKKAMSHLQTQCGIINGYQFSEPVSRFGWTFFKLALNPGLLDGIEKKFSDMVRRYKGKPPEKILSFLSDYFESRGCKTKLKMIDA